MNIVIEYDSSAANAPAGFKTAVQAAVAYYDSLITTNITVPIVFSYGEIEGQSLSSGALGESDGNGYFLTYSQVKADLVKTATSAADIAAVLALPATDPTHGGTYWVTDAQAKAFGITGNPNFIDPEDGFVGLTSKYPLNFSASNSSVAGEYSAVGILEHEISEVMGRTSGLGTWTDNGTPVYTPLDLFRYASPGVRDLTGTGSAYFSVTGQTLLDPYNSVASGADPGDWGPSVYGDSYGYGSAGQAGVVTSVDQLEMDVLGYTLSTTSTTGPQLVSITYTEFAADTATLAEITASFNLTVTGVSVANRAAVEAAAHVTAITISDTAADITAALATLNADTEISSIVISDNAALTVTAAQKTADARALAELVDANGAAAVVTVGTGTSGGSGSNPVLTATAATISGELDSLNANTAVTSVVISDNAAITLTASQWLNDSHVLGELKNQNGQAYVLDIQDTAADVAAHLDALNSAAHIGTIALTGASQLTVTAAQALNDKTALAKITGSWTLAVADTGGAISSSLDSLNADTALTSVTISDNAAITLSTTQWLNDTRVLGELKDQNGQAYVLDIKDTASAVAAHLNALNSAAHIGVITLTDTSRLTVNAAQAADDGSALGKIAGGWSLNVADTAADLSNALSTLRSDTHVAALTVTDSGVISLSNSNYAADAALLAKIGGAHTLDITGITGQSYTSEVLAYNAAGALATETFLSATAVTVYGLTSGQTFASPTVTETVWAQATGDTFVIAPGAASETINDFNLTTDVLSFSHTLFTTAAQVLADAASDGHGGVLIHDGTLKIDIAGVTLTQLQQHSSDFHFY